MGNPIWVYDSGKNVGIQMELRDLKPGEGMVIPRSDPACPSDKRLRIWVNKQETLGGRYELKCVGHGAPAGVAGDWLVWCLSYEHPDGSISDHHPLPADFPISKGGRPASALRAELEAMELFSERRFPLPAENAIGFVNRLRVNASLLGKTTGTYYSTSVANGEIVVVRTQEKL